MNNPTAPFGNGPSINQIIDTYGGNKQKIAQAIQMGIVDPTKGLLAGMQIDRVRGAAAAEKAPPTTVAQQTFNPAPPAPPPPPQGAPPQQMASAPPPPPPQGAPPQMAARGGIMALAGGGDASQRAINSLRYNTDQNYSLSAPGWLDHMYLRMGDGSRRAFRNSNQNSRGDTERLRKVVPGGHNRVPQEGGYVDYVHKPIMDNAYWNKLVEENAMDQDETPYHMGEGDWTIEDLRKMKQHPPRWWGDSGADHTKVDFPDDGHASGGLIDLPLPNSMFNERHFAPGGIVAFGSGGDLAEKKKRLYAIINNDAVPSETRRAARVQLNSLYNQGSSDVGLPDLSPITNATYDGPRGMDLVNSLLPNSPQSSSGSIYNPSGGSAGPSYDPYLASASKNIVPEADPYGASASVDMPPPADYSAPGWYGIGAKGNRGSLPDLSSITDAAQRQNDADMTTNYGMGTGLGKLRDVIGLDPKTRAIRDSKTLRDPAPKSHWGGLGVDQASEVGDSYLTDRAGNPYSPGMQDAFTPPPPAPRRPHDIMYDKKFSPPPSGGSSSDVNLIPDGTFAPTVKDPAITGPNFDEYNTGELYPNPLRSSKGLGAFLSDGAPPTSTGRKPLGADSYTSTGKISSKGKTQIADAVGVPKNDLKGYVDQIAALSPAYPTDPSLAGEADKLKADKKEDMWTSLAQFGFALASSKSPYFLQGVGEAGTATMPGIQKSLEAQRKGERELLKDQQAERVGKYQAKRSDIAAAIPLVSEDKKNNTALQVEAMRAANAVQVEGMRSASVRDAADRNPYVRGALAAVAAAGYSPDSKEGAKVFSDAISGYFVTPKLDADTTRKQGYAEASATKALDGDQAYMRLASKGSKDPKAKAAAEAYRDNVYKKAYQRFGLDYDGLTAKTTADDPLGFR